MSNGNPPLPPAHNGISALTSIQSHDNQDYEKLILEQQQIAALAMPNNNPMDPQYSNIIHPGMNLPPNSQQFGFNANGQFDINQLLNSKKKKSKKDKKAKKSKKGEKLGKSIYEKYTSEDLQKLSDKELKKLHKKEKKRRKNEKNKKREQKLVKKLEELRLGGVRKTL